MGKDISFITQIWTLEASYTVKHCVFHQYEFFFIAPDYRQYLKNAITFKNEMFTC